MMKQLTQRLLTGWTFMRLFYALMGSLILIESLYQQQWMASLF